MAPWLSASLFNGDQTGGDDRGKGREILYASIEHLFNESRVTGRVHGILLGRRLKTQQVSSKYIYLPEKSSKIVIATNIFLRIISDAGNFKEKCSYCGKFQNLLVRQITYFSELR